MKRRVLIAALLLACVGLGLWWLRRSHPDEDSEDAPFAEDGEVRGARPNPPLEEFRFENGEPGLSFFALGDTGWGGEALQANAAAMRLSAERRPVDLVLLLGDNFYLFGTKSLEDSRWRTHFEDAFTGPELQVPFCAVLGNHDHRGDIAVQIAYTEHSRRWWMPARWYTVTREIRGGGEVQFFALDTQVLQGSETVEGPRIRTWLEDELRKSKADWKIVFGHHPVLSHGKHGESAAFVEDMAPLFERYGVDLYVSGHDHDLQLLKAKAGWLQIVSGAGSSTRDTSYGDNTLFAASSLGYAWVGVSAEEMWVEFVTVRGGPQFRWRVEKPSTRRSR